MELYNNTVQNIRNTHNILNSCTRRRTSRYTLLQQVYIWRSLRVGQSGMINRDTSSTLASDFDQTPPDKGDKNTSPFITRAFNPFADTSYRLPIKQRVSTSVYHIHIPYPTYILDALCTYRVSPEYSNYLFSYAVRTCIISLFAL